MRMIWARKKTSPQAAVDRMHFVVWDFLKMFSAAVVCGVAVSMAAAGVTLLLSGHAEARQIAADDLSEEASAGPGSLMISDGCDAMVLPALERDWQVSINGKAIEVRVMQTWVVPSEADGVAVFQVQLPHGARLKTLTAQTPNRDWQAKLVKLADYEALTPAGYLKLTRDRLVAAQSSTGAISTSPLLGLVADQSVVVQYTYAIVAEESQGMNRLSLPLQTAEAAPSGQGQNQNVDLLAIDSKTIPAAVSVEWIGRKPAKVIGLPSDTSMEKTALGIQSVLWNTDRLQLGEHFQIAWSM